MWIAIATMALASSDVGFSEEACPTSHAHFKVRRGVGSGPTRVAAMKAARADAMRVARIDVCGAALAGSPRCDARMAQVAPAGTPEATKVRGRYEACHSVAIDWDKVNPLEADLEAWNRQIAAFGASVRAETGNAAVYVDGPKWGTGCPLGRSGTHIEQKIRAALASVADWYDPEATTVLRLRVGITSAEATLSGEIKAPGAATWAPVAPISWSSDLVEDRPEWGKECFDDAALGIPEGRRSGASGLDIELILDPPSSEFCGGQEITVTMASDRPARIRLLSVAADGSALQVWPAGGEPDRTAPGAPLSFPTAMLLGSGGQERMVLVGIADGDGWGRLGGARSCVLPDGFLDEIPAGAAVVARGYRVSRDPRVCRSEDVDPVMEAELLQVLKQLPRCW